MALHCTPEFVFVGDSGGPLGRGGAAVALAADFQLRRMCLAETLNREAQDAVLHLCFQNPAYCILLRRPEMQEALVVLAGDRILCLSQVEGDRGVFEHDRTCGLAQELIQCACE